MRAFDYIRAIDLKGAIAAVSGDPHASYLAGGTTQIDLMKDGVLNPARVVDITRLPLRGIVNQRASLVVGALTTMEELAADPVVMLRLGFVREALLKGASPQLRNMATIGGNILQRTRCRYFRDPTVRACNKREPGTGCAAITGAHRQHAILGTSDSCIAVHASDVAVPFIALDALVHIHGEEGLRMVPLREFYRLPGDTPGVENILIHGELITALELPLLNEQARSTYLKVRDRASYEFALTSAAVAMVLKDNMMQDVRVALGGVGTIPWRASEAEAILSGSAPATSAFVQAAKAALANAKTYAQNRFKVRLAERTIVRALQTVTGIQ